LGVTWSSDGHLFIVIFKERHEDEIRIFKTLVHEMVHTVQSQRKLKGTVHGKEFKKFGKEILQNLKVNMSAFHAPYCSVDLDEKEILSAKDSW
jgi:predicted SprT family Zn-dependent metalloprotease